MNVRCPSCETVYRVDPSKVPGGGIRARCTECAGVIPVPEPEESSRRPERRSAVRPPRFVPSEGPASADTVPSVAAEPVGVEDDAAAPAGAQADAGPSAARDAAAKPAVRVSPPMSGLKVTAPAMPPGRRPGGKPARPVIVAPDAEEPPRPAQRPKAPVFRPTEGPPMAAPPVPPDTEPATATAAGPTPERPTAPSELRGAASRPEDREAAAVPQRSPTAETSGQVARSAAARPAAPTRPAATEPAPPRSAVNPFLSRDPRQKARRLARALVSDMIVYQPEKRQQALAAGKLKESFAEEIQKSWEEFVGQVGEEMAKSTPFFTDALNEILAGGKKIF